MSNKRNVVKIAGIIRKRAVIKNKRVVLEIHMLPKYEEQCPDLRYVAKNK